MTASVGRGAMEMEERLMAVFGLAQFQSFHEIRRRRLVHAGFEKRRPSLLVPRQFIRLRRHLVWGQRHEHKCREAKNCLATVSHIDSPRPDQAGASGFTIGLIIPRRYFFFRATGAPMGSTDTDL